MVAGKVLYITTKDDEAANVHDYTLGFFFLFFVFPFFPIFRTKLYRKVGCYSFIAFLVACLLILISRENLFLNVYPTDVSVSRDWVGGKWIDVKLKPNILFVIG